MIIRDCQRRMECSFHRRSSFHRSSFVALSSSAYVAALILLISAQLIPVNIAKNSTSTTTSLSSSNNNPNKSNVSSSSNPESRSPAEEAEDDYLNLSSYYSSSPTTTTQPSSTSITTTPPSTSTMTPPSTTTPSASNNNNNNNNRHNQNDDSEQAAAAQESAQATATESVVNDGDVYANYDNYLGESGSSSVVEGDESDGGGINQPQRIVTIKIYPAPADPVRIRPTEESGAGLDDLMESATAGDTRRRPTNKSPSDLVPFLSFSKQGNDRLRNEKQNPSAIGEVGIPQMIPGARLIENEINRKDQPPTMIEVDSNYVDFSLLCENGGPLLDGNLEPESCSPTGDDQCPAGYWCHIGSSKQTTYCCPDNPQGLNGCRLAPSPGYSTSEMTRWWFDWTSGVCRNFTYTGFGGNQNNFVTKELCNAVCNPDYVGTVPADPNIVIVSRPVERPVVERRRPVVSVQNVITVGRVTRMNPRCFDKPKVFGHGSALAQKWYYDTQTRLCRNFTYHDNRQNIRQQQSLSLSTSSSSSDPCILPIDEGQTSKDGLNQVSSRYAWDNQQMICREFTYNGAAGNSNNFLNIQQCEDTCGPSEIPMASACSEEGGVRGAGSFQIRRWAFDAGTGVCNPFYYSGCCGNKNRFTSRNDCIRTCANSGLQTGSMNNNNNNNNLVNGPGANLPPSSSNNANNGQNIRNQNPFNTNNNNNQFTPSPSNGSLGLQQLQNGSPCIGGAQSTGFCSAQTNYQCQTGSFCHVGASTQTTVCCPSTGNVCQQPRADGSGTANLPRYYFDSQTRRCLNFNFRGLQGNANNFLTYDRCQAACSNTNPCGSGSPYARNGQNINCSPSQQSICPNGYFCHIGVDTTTSVCCPASAGSPCTLPRVQGSGQGQLQRFSFDPNSQSCQPFMYTGLGGNQNNFLTQADCVGQCQQQQQQNACGAGGLGSGSFCSTANLNSCPVGQFCHVGAGQESTLCCRNQAATACDAPLSTGLGNAVLGRWYFDRATSTCKAFTYTGLGGNENNFLSLADCRRVCPEYDNPCPAGNPPVNAATGQVNFCSNINPSCPSTYWCHVGDSRQTSVCCPFAANPCAMPRAVGTGTAALPRWYYDPLARICKTFTYTGKAGNQNNFQGKAECESTCPVVDNPCSQGMPAVSTDGNPLLCSTANPNICPASYYCHIGSNSATTLCCPGAGDPCRMPRSQGNGNAVMNRWYFNTDTKTCLSYTYSGRGGNQNNFISIAECRLRCPEFQNPCSTGQPHIGLTGQITNCGATTPSICPTTFWCHVGSTLETSVCCPGAGNPCDLPMSTGNGNGNLLRYFYDLATQTCRQFQYSGMNGNQNNFMTQRDCEARCPVFRNPCGNGDPARSSVGQVVPCSVSNLNSCPSSYYCHIGSDEQSTLCCPAAGQTPCTSSLVVGTGTGSLPRHYFNSLTQQCLPFLYSGMGGNQNNFLSRADCERTCPVFANPCAAGDPATGANGQYTLCTSTSPNVCPAGYWCHIGALNTNSVCCPGAENPCLLPVVTGNGNAAVNRWYFDVNLRRCTRFTYSASGGNQNNFLTIQDCQLRCPEFRNPCANGDPGQAPTGGILFCSTTARTCPASFWCHIGDNTESTVCCPGASDPCLQAMVPGSGSSKMQRFYFNQNSRQCLQFTYTGRGGNQNNFLSEADCTAGCPVFQNPCSSLLNPPQVTYCTSQSRDVCPAGYWCHIGLTSQSSVCCPGASDPCAIDQSQGRTSGTGPITRWYFDRSSRQCRQFQYTGLGGNENNFLTRTECAQKCPEFTNPCLNSQPFRETVTNLVRYCTRNTPTDCPQNYWCHIGATDQSTVCCPGSQDPCTVQLAIGQGGGSLTRWFYNSATRQCQQFTYTGIGGNQNNFMTQADCRSKCPEFTNPCGNGTPLTSLAGQITYCTANNPNICPINYYCHFGVSQQTTLCCPNIGGNPCNLPQSVGRGSSSLGRYYFNGLTRKCESFIYTGLGGNANNFMTLAACRQRCPEFGNPCKGQPYRSAGGQTLFCNAQSVCPPNFFCHYGGDTTSTVCCPTAGDPCIQTVELGNGALQLDRFYYNQAIRQCVPFVYSGMGGNQNNFRSAPECQARCQPTQSPCNNGAQPFTDVSGNIVRCANANGNVNACPSNYFCQVGQDVFQSACCPVNNNNNNLRNSPNRCEETVERGSGTARVTRWFYNRQFGRCEMFVYYGSGGRGNNFRSQAECQQACDSIRSTRLQETTAEQMSSSNGRGTSFCLQGEPMITQQGRPINCQNANGNYQKLETEQCPDVNYICHIDDSGAGKCCPSPRSFCLQPRDFGDVRCLSNGGTQKKFGYNPGTDRCVEFQYTGCGGNLNNFHSLTACENICTNKGYNFLRLADAVEFPLPESRRRERPPASLPASYPNSSSVITVQKDDPIPSAADNQQFSTPSKDSEKSESSDKKSAEETTSAETKSWIQTLWQSLF